MDTNFAPDFFVIGAMKCGSTSVANALRLHPQIFLPREKSLNYYSVGLAEDLEPGLAPLRGRAITAAAHYQAAFAGAKPNQLTGDCSETSYFVQGTARRISQANKNAKIVLLVRCPVARAYSSFNHARGHALEDEPSFLTAFARAESVHTLPMLRYKSLGMYHELLRPYLDFFPKDQILLLRLEDLVSCPSTAMTRLQKFLDVEQRPLPLPASNASVVPPSLLEGRVQFKLLQAFRPVLHGLTRKKTVRRIARHVQSQIYGRPPKLSDQIQKELASAFEEDQRNLNARIVDYA